MRLHEKYSAFLHADLRRRAFFAGQENGRRTGTERPYPLMTGIQAIVWDLDGMWGDTEGLMFQAMRGMHAERYGDNTDYVPLSARDDLLFRGAGKEAMGMFVRDYLGNPQASKEEIEEARLKRDGVYRTLLFAQDPSFPRLKELIGGLASIGVPQAIATSAASDQKDMLFAAVNYPPDYIARTFSHILTRDDVAEDGRGKVAVYEDLRRRLKAEGIEAERCVAFEDSLPGLTAAHDMGFSAVAKPLGPMAQDPAYLKEIGDLSIATVHTVEDIEWMVRLGVIQFDSVPVQEIRIGRNVVIFAPFGTP